MGEEEKRCTESQAKFVKELCFDLLRRNEGDKKYEYLNHVIKRVQDLSIGEVSVLIQHLLYSRASNRKNFDVNLWFEAIQDNLAPKL